MSDIVDHAALHTEAWLALNIGAVTCNPPPNPVNHCIDCGCPIGTVRKRVLPYAVRCMPCQDCLEKTAEKTA